MASVKNISGGPKGIWSTSGLVMIEAGKSANVDLAPGDHATDYFEIDSENAEPGPLDGSVTELEDHLANVTDPDEVQKLIDAETAGKSRKGALAALEARRDELLA